MVMCQKKYALEFIAKMRLSGSKPASSPVHSSIKLTSVEYDSFIHKENPDYHINDRLLPDISITG